MWDLSGSFRKPQITASVDIVSLHNLSRWVARAFYEHDASRLMKQNCLSHLPIEDNTIVYTLNEMSASGPSRDKMKKNRDKILKTLVDMGYSVEEIDDIVLSRFNDRSGHQHSFTVMSGAENFLHCA